MQRKRYTCMTSPQFADISGFQPSVDWQAYKAWASQWDGIARVAIKATEGIGFKDPSFDAHRAGALSIGIDQIFYYHYGRPDLGNDPIAEADWFLSVVAAIRPQDMLFLDIEENWSGDVAGWCVKFLSQFKNCGLYSYPSYITCYLQDGRLAPFALWYASWSYSSDTRPVVPAPWSSYIAVQFSDKATIPGIGQADCNIWLGGLMSGVPQGWSDDGTTLVAPSGHKVVSGFREYVISHSWDPNNVPLEEEHGRTPVESYYPSEGGSVQTFNYARLCWTPKRGVYVEGIGNELLGCERELATLKSQTPVTDLASIAQIADKYKV